MPVATVADLRRARRVLLHGVTGSGKTTAAVALGERLGLPVHLADEEFGWLPGWVQRPREEMRALAALRAAGLVSTARQGHAVVHRLTALGHDLLRAT